MEKLSFHTVDTSWFPTKTQVMKKIGIAWIIFIAAMVYLQNMDLLFIALPLAFFSIYEYRRRQEPAFTDVVLYEHQIGFIMNGEEKTVPYDHVLFGHRPARFISIECKALGLPHREYPLSVFSEPNLFLSHIERYGNWNLTDYKPK